jgi:hypothetical protein
MDRKWTEFGQGVGRGKPKKLNIYFRGLLTFAQISRIEAFFGAWASYRLYR